MPSSPESPPPDKSARRGSPPPPGSAEDTLRRLEERLDRASEAAERLIAEATEAAAGGLGGGNPSTPPPSGWQTAEDTPAPPEVDPFVALVKALRDLVPPDLQRRLVAALREVLLALRALIDWYLERLERQREEAVEVQDIPIL
jgi:hypothetical protein